MTHTRTYRPMLFTLALFCLVADLGSKYGVFRALYVEGTVWGDREIVPGMFRLHVDYRPRPEEETCDCVLVTLNGPIPPRVNHGALFGLGNDHEHLANRVFTGISLAAALAIGIWAFRPETRSDRLLCVALGMILGGTLGNAYDRVVFGGVRDFLYFYLIDWPVFNIADCCLVCGAGLLLFHALRTPSKGGV